MPPGGDGYYYFSTYLLGDDAEYAYFNLEVNGNFLCTICVDNSDQGAVGDFPQSACSTAIYTAEGTKPQQFLIWRTNKSDECNLLLYVFLNDLSLLFTGDTVQFVYRSGTDTTPLYDATSYY